MIPTMVHQSVTGQSSWTAALPHQPCVGISILAAAVFPGHVICATRKHPRPLDVTNRLLRLLHLGTILRGLADKEASVVDLVGVCVPVLFQSQYDFTGVDQEDCHERFTRPWQDEPD